MPIGAFLGEILLTAAPPRVRAVTVSPVISRVPTCNVVTMGWFGSGRARSVEETLSSTLQRIFDAQARQIEVFSDLLSKMSELSIKRAASALGTRSAQARARARKAVDKARPSCRLCINGSITNPTAQEIIAHAGHETEPEPEPGQPEPGRKLDS
jgi:hypothetical protein